MKKKHRLDILIYLGILVSGLVLLGSSVLLVFAVYLYRKGLPSSQIFILAAIALSSGISILTLLKKVVKTWKKALFWFIPLFFIILIISIIIMPVVLLNIFLG